MSNKRSKGVRLREMQTRKDRMLAQNGTTKKYCGDVPVEVIWKHRAERLEETRRGGDKNGQQ